MSRVGKHILFITLLALAIGAAYATSIGHPFIFDDHDSVLNNLSIRTLDPAISFNPPANISTSGRPLVNFSFALNYSLGGLNPTGYHIGNIVIHFLAAATLMAIVRRALRAYYPSTHLTEDTAHGLAFAVALVWALHPLQTESVMYLTQRTELLAGLCYLLTLYGALRYWGDGSGRDGNHGAWLAAVGLAGWAGAACKEIAVTVPAMVLLFDRTFRSGSFIKALRSSKALYLTLLSSWALVLLMNLSGPRSDTAGFGVGIPPYVWWLTQSEVLIRYLGLAFWPWPLNIHYNLPYLATLPEGLPWAVPVLLLLLTVAFGVAKRRPWGFLGAWVVVILSPTLVVPIATEVMAERRMYLPLAALVTLVMVGTAHLAAKACAAGSRRWVGPYLAVTAVLGILMSSVVVHRSAAFSSEVSIWQDVVSRNPGDYFARSNLGIALQRAFRFQEGMAQFQEALRINPRYEIANWNLGNCFEARGASAQAIQHYRRALQSNPNLAGARIDLGALLFKEGRFEEGLEHLRMARKLRPGDPDLLRTVADLKGAAEVQGNNDLARAVGALADPR